MTLNTNASSIYEQLVESCLRRFELLLLKGAAVTVSLNGDDVNVVSERPLPAIVPPHRAVQDTTAMQLTAVELTFEFPSPNVFAEIRHIPLKSDVAIVWYFLQRVDSFGPFLCLIF